MEVEDENLKGWTHGCFGGIVGGSDIGYRLEYCSNNGQIETKAEWVGGLIGDLKGVIVDSNNNANVKGTNDVGGLVGLIYKDGIIKNSKNLGKVIGTGNFGNVYGRNLKTENDNVINCGENS